MYSCFECNSTVNIHHHHVVPQVKGGTKTIPLCEECHGKVHNIDFTDHSILTKEGLKRAKDKGIKLGSPNNLTKEVKQKGSESIKNNRLNNSNWILCKEFIEDYSKTYGKVNYTHISNLLNEQGHKTRHGKEFTPTSVRRIYVDFFPEVRPLGRT